MQICDSHTFHMLPHFLINEWKENVESKGMRVNMNKTKENVRWCGRRLLDGHAGSAIKVLVAIHYSVLDARNGYIRNVVV